MKNGFSSSFLGRVGSRAALTACALSVFSASVFSPNGLAKSPKSGAGREGAHERIPGELIIQLKKEAVSSSTAGDRALRSLLSKSFSVTALRTSQIDPGLKVARLKKDTDVEKAIALLKDQPGIEHVEPNYVVRILGMPNDPSFSDLWGLQNVGQTDAAAPGMAASAGRPGADVGVLPLWRQGIRGSHRVVVAVIDTGIDWAHEDLVDNLYTNPGESGPLATNGIDDDRNGFIDDVHGWNFALDENNRPQSNNDSTDDQGHGTHVAGTIGARGDNGIGIVGVNWEVSLLPVKFLNRRGMGGTAGAIESVRYATRMGVNIMNNSWGGGPHSPLLEQAIRDARDAGILFVAASGNELQNNDRTLTYPASYDLDNVLSVGAMDNQGRMSVWRSPDRWNPGRTIVSGGSNYGRTQVDVFAPGTKIKSAFPGNKLCQRIPPPAPPATPAPCRIPADLYLTWNGTSMATPHASGVAALLLSANPWMTYSELKSRMMRTAIPTRSLRDRGVSGGYVNAHHALNDIVTPAEYPDPNAWQVVAQRHESAHPYANLADEVLTIQHPGAKYIRVHFETIDVETQYDFIHIEDASGDLLETLTGTYANHTSVDVPGDTLRVRLESDQDITDFGYVISHIEVIQ
jgi:thermitase